MRITCVMPASPLPTPALLAKVVDLIDHVPMDDRDTKGDVYEYMLGKIASAGQNGQFRTPRHIIRLMVELTAPMPKDVLCDPACGHLRFSGGHRRVSARAPSRIFSRTPSCANISTTICSTDTTPTRPCSASAA